MAISFKLICSEFLTAKEKELVTIKTTKYIALIDASEGFQTTSDKLNSMNSDDLRVRIFVIVYDKTQ